MNQRDMAEPALDLSLCAQEPIHIPASIQPHGALLVALADGLRVTHASANLGAVLGCTAEAALGRPLSEALGDAACRALLGAKQQDDSRAGVHTIAGPKGVTLHLRAHPSGQRVCVDIEPLLPQPWQRPPLTLAQVLIESFNDAKSLDDLCNIAVQGLRSISRYDRVMAYRFGADGHGEVIAESLAPGLEPYLGQRYPASDIPAQARRLYLRQRVGVIVDAAYEPVPLMVDRSLDDGTPLDLTHSTLRSVSPVHREFMRNMQTAASMTIGLAQGHDENRVLWGMLVCHHQTPRAAGPEVRAIADMIGQVVSLLLDSKGAADVYVEQFARTETLHALTDQLGHAGSLLDTLATHQILLLKLLNAGGAMICFQGASWLVGRTPDADAAAQVFTALHPGAGGDVVAVDNLGLKYPYLADLSATSSGALLLPLGDSAEDGILWFRPELIRTVTWGGNPDKPVAPNSIAGKISPRASFTAWKEVLRGHSAPWSAADAALALELRRAIEAEAARRNREALDLYDGVFESSPSALILAGPDGRIKMVNRLAEEMFGYERTDLKDKSMEMLMPERFRSRHVAHRQRYRQHMVLRPAGDGLDLIGLRKDGSEFPIEVGLNPLASLSFAGEPLVQASITDITLRRANERQRRKIEERLNSIATHVPAMIGYWNSEQVCEFANEEYHTWFGIPTERMIGMPLREFAGDELYALIEPYILQVLAGEEQRFQAPLTRVDGVESIVDAHYIPDRVSDGSVRGFYVLATDITPLRKALAEIEVVNAKLKFTNQELDEFVYTAAHDLRGPLRAIDALSAMIREDDTELGAETRERMALIEGRAKRMQRLLDDVLAYARAGTGDHQGGAPITAEVLVDEIVATMQVPAGFSIVKDGSLAAASVSPVPLFQVLHNLIGNAIKHHDRTDGTVTVAVLDRGKDLRFTVSDDGPGIPEAYRESVFKLYTTLKRRDEVEASGMGLALVRKLVTLHGGSCGIESSAHPGAHFYFEWPKPKGETGGNASQ
jgi:PAS domain S-box-containing protein